MCEEVGFGSGDMDEMDEYSMDSTEDIARIDLSNFCEDDVLRLHFGSLCLAYEFYNVYAKARGFSIRKSKSRKNGKLEVVQQVFVCSREGYREEKYYNMENRRREPKPETRCGCMARVQVRLEGAIGRWIVTYFCDEHNHERVNPRFVGLLRSHKKMTRGDICQMNSMINVGISTPLIFGSLASQCGGYEHIGFTVKDMHNQVAKQRRQVAGDAKSALLYLGDLASTDPHMFFRYDVDGGGMLRHLFWSDGISQVDYQLFGDVVAFDATYKKNKYRCPLVVFSGVNHHNQTVVFAGALISDESLGTYIWVLEQFMEAMKGKAPISVITDGDASMKGAIEKVFPNAHHRLCAWHLMRNATSHIGNPSFTAMFRKCMLGDYEVGVFERKWQQMVEEFGVEDHQWILDLYERRKMWATAHIRGKFFAGFRTTSRCEGLHSLLAKYVKSRYNLTEFVRHFQRCLSYLRYKEGLAEFASISREPVMQTQLEILERSAAKLYTREVFFLFRPMLQRACGMKVMYSKETASCVIYGVSKYCKPNSMWHISCYEDGKEFKCSCLRMESLGIPCDHLIAVLVYLDISELPKSLVLDRWTKNCKEAVMELNGKRGLTWDSLGVSRYGCLMHWCKNVSIEAIMKGRYFETVLETLIGLYDWIEEDKEQDIVVEDRGSGSCQGFVNVTDFPREPQCVRTKGCSAQTGRSSSRGKSKRCGVCRREGHNRTSYPVRRHIENVEKSVYGESLSVEDAVDADIYND